MKEREQNFTKEYNKLNKAQKEAVDTIEGPVMVVAGPGTGKTQVLALRIAHILKNTDVGADSILCLTFTNSGVKAMRERLREYIGPESSKVHISTFHSFAMTVIEQYFQVLDRDDVPTVMDESDAVLLSDSILHEHEWNYIRPRSDTSRYFNDLKNLISLLKRERVSATSFKDLIEKEISTFESDPDNISSRGATKGELKKDVQKKIDGLRRTEEAVRFYELYEEIKKEKNLFDYDDVLTHLVKIVENSEEAAYDIKEKYQYILVDEHQDSSGIQNEFLEKVWKGEERPNIFVVGDDRQLIYGFSGASLAYFDNFKHTFGKASLITLEENYRSTEKILDLSHNLLQSSLAEGKLKSNVKGDHAVRLVEASYPRDEIIMAGLEIKDRVNRGENVNEMAILVPKNKHVRSAIHILRDMGIAVAGGESMDFFEREETLAFLNVLRIIVAPENGVAISESLFNKYSGIDPLQAHKFIRTEDMRKFSILDIPPRENTLFPEGDPVYVWIEKLKSWMSRSSELGLYSFLQSVGSEFLLQNVKNHAELTGRVEVVRTFLHLALSQIERNSKVTLKEFVSLLSRLESYGEHIPLAIFSAETGVRVLTLHGSKGLEFEYVWIAHMDQKSLSSSRHGGFTLPEILEEKKEKQDEEVLKRQLYVAITRAKRFCTLSYALHSYSGGALELAHIVANLSEHFEKQNKDETEEIILKADPALYVEKKELESAPFTKSPLQDLVREDYVNRKVSVSLLNNFFECPWKWYFRNLLQLPEEKSASLEFGSAVHSAVDKILRLGHHPSPKELEDITRGDKEVLSIVSKWVEKRLGSIQSKRESEKSVSLKIDEFPHLNFYGKLDLIEYLDSNSIRVTDFKTGGVRKKADIEKEDDEGRMSNYKRQLAMYSFLIEKNPKWKLKVRESRLEFLEAEGGKDSIYDTKITEEEINLLIKDIKEYENSIKNGDWVSRPCDYNSFGKGDSCPYCKMSQIYNEK